MADGATRDRAAVVERLRELLRRPDVAAILLSGPARCGKTTAAVEAVASLASSGFCLSRWDVGAASCAATSIHQQCSQQQRPQRTSRGLDRFVTAQGTTTVLLADDRVFVLRPNFVGVEAERGGAVTPLDPSWVAGDESG